MKKLIFVLLTVIMSSCKTIYVDRPIETIVHDTLKITSEKVDTLIQKDSIFVYKNGDTVYTSIYRDRYNTKYIHDTLYQHLTDSIAYPEYIDREVKVKVIPWYNKVLNCFGLIFLIIVGYKLFYFFKKIKK